MIDERKRKQFVAHLVKELHNCIISSMFICFITFKNLPVSSSLCAIEKFLILLRPFSCFLLSKRICVIMSEYTWSISAGSLKELKIFLLIKAFRSSKTSYNIRAKILQSNFFLKSSSDVIISLSK